MTTLTIDQILAEVQEEGFTEINSITKEASTQSLNAKSDIDDVDSMVDFLKTASIDSEISQPVVEARTLQEKVAEAIILNHVLTEEEVSPEQMFKTAALNAGYQEEEIDQFILEKTSAPTGRQVAQAAKLVAGAGLVGGTSAYYGNKKGTKKGRKQGFRVGRVVQHQLDKRNFGNYLRRAQSQKAATTVRG